jgi:plasmid stabilization system protein ParE
MSYTVHITDRAISDVDTAVARIAQQAPRNAANWHVRLLTSLQSLEYNPRTYPLAEEAQDLKIELREMLFGKRSGVWRILFTIEGDKVNVLHVRHAARDRLTAEDV